MAANQFFFGTEKTAARATLTAAYTDRDGSDAGLTTLIAGTATGRSVIGVVFKAIGSTSDGLILIFVYDGTNNIFFDEIEVDAVTPSGTVPSFQRVWSPPVPLTLYGTGFELRAGSYTGDDFHVTTVHGDK
jgi:hypothetical protein